jgi:hypothetical protein
MKEWNTQLFADALFKVGDHISVSEETATGVVISENQGIVGGISIVNFDSHQSLMYSVIMDEGTTIHDYFEWQLKAVIEHAQTR